MYKIKAKKGYNIVIKDLDIVLRSEVDKWSYVEKEAFDASADVKKLEKYLEIEDVLAVEEVKTENQLDEKVKQINETVFVMEGRTYQNPDNVFVAQPKTTEVEENNIETEKIVGNLDKEQLSTLDSKNVEKLATDLNVEVKNTVEETINAITSVEVETEVSKQTGKRGRPKK